MAHKVWYLTKDTTDMGTSFNQYRSQIEIAWKEVFSEGAMSNTNFDLYIPNKIRIGLVAVMSPQVNDSSPASVSGACCALLTETGLKFFNIYGGVYGTPAHASETSFEAPLYLHMITGKQNKTVVLGLSDSADRIGAQVLVSQIDADNYVGIQLGVNPYGRLREYAIDAHSSASIANCGNDRYDGYVKDDLTTTARTQSLYGPGWYITDDILTISPAVDPWRGKVIPDTYISVCGPYNKAGLDGIISIGNRKFMTGHTFSYNGSGKVPWTDTTGLQITDGGIVTFLEVE